MKKAFSFLELMIVIILLSSLYLFVIPNFNKKVLSQNKDISLKNLKQYLLKNYSFKDELRFICIENGIKCYVLIDKKISKENEIKNLFISKPEVYTYKNLLNKIEFSNLKFENYEEYEVCFEYIINNDMKSNSFVVFYNERAYLFNAINDKVEVFLSLSSVDDFLETKIKEVKNAF